MISQKIALKCLFLLALIFSFIIFFYVKGNNGTDNAPQETPRSAVTAPPESGASEPPVVPPSTVPAKPVTPLKMPDEQALALLAIFQANSPLASAVISTEGHGAGQYRVGGVLPDGGVLTAIQPSEVLIYRNGRQITLRIPSMGGGSKASSVETGPAQTDHPQLPWQLVAFMEKMDLTPVNDGAPDGYLVGEGFPKSGTEEVGVKPGDTIVAVNGYPVGEYHSDYLVWLSFKDRYRASVLVRRETGEEFSFYFPDDLKSVTVTPGG